MKNILTFFIVCITTSILAAPEIRDPFLKSPPAESAYKKSDYGIENFNINELKLVGRLKIDSFYWAILLDPQGKYYHVTTGDIIGRQQAKITAILADEILLTIDETENIKSSTFTLKLSKNSNE